MSRDKWRKHRSMVLIMTVLRLTHLSPSSPPPSTLHPDPQFRTKVRSNFLALCLEGSVTFIEEDQSNYLGPVNPVGAADLSVTLVSISSASQSGQSPRTPSALVVSPEFTFLHALGLRLRLLLSIFFFLFFVGFAESPDPS